MRWRPQIWKGNWPTAYGKHLSYWMISLWRTNAPPNGLPKGYWYLVFIRFEYPIRVKLVKVQMGKSAMAYSRPLFYEAKGYFAEDTSEEWHGKFSFTYFEPPQYVKAVGLEEGEKKAWRVAAHSFKLIDDVYKKLSESREEIEALKQELKFRKEM